MVKRLFDVVGASVLLALAAPLLAFCAVVIRLTSSGPALFRATRAGVGGREFTMYKLRTMHHRPDGGGSRITAIDDPRVSLFGKVLRKTHLDELPQLVNVLKGDMSLVGPRPEDVGIVAQHYTAEMRATLDVRPGLTSPGALFMYTHGDDGVEGGVDTEANYVENMLPLKLALEFVYMERQSLVYDVQLLWRTAALLAHLLSNRGHPPELPELTRALELASP